MSEGMKENLSNGDHWLRLLVTLIYALIFTLGAWVLGFVVLLNLLIVLFTGERNRNLVEFGGQLGGYLGQIMTYATCNSDLKPFPFGEWGPPAAAEAPLEAAPKAAESPAPGAAKAPARKKTVTRKTSKKPASKGDG